MKIESRVLKCDLRCDLELSTSLSCGCGLAELEVRAGEVLQCSVPPAPLLTGGRAGG